MFNNDEVAHNILVSFHKLQAIHSKKRLHVRKITVAESAAIMYSLELELIYVLYNCGSRAIGLNNYFGDETSDLIETKIRP